MKPVQLSQIIHWTSGERLDDGSDVQISHITIDSRKVHEGSLFVALGGEHVDGHDYIDDAFNRGAAAALISQKLTTNIGLSEKGPLVHVNNCLESLALIAAQYRLLFPCKIIAVTGSYGKTTTKDMISAVLETRYQTLKNQGNFNNHIGLPLTLFDLDPTHEVAVLEMGMSGPGEIKKLSNIAKPDIAVITGIGWSHIEKLGSIENIGLAKLEIIEGLKPEGLLVVNGDDQRLLRMLEGRINSNRLIKVGKDPSNDFWGSLAGENTAEGFSFFTSDHDQMLFHVNHPGAFHMINALFAVWIGSCFQLSGEDIQKGLARFKASAMRMEICRVAGRLWINDAYNANPDSMREAIMVLGNYKNCSRIAVLGDMHELGDHSELLHRSVAPAVIKADLDHVFLVGERAAWIGQESLANGMTAERIHFINDIKNVAKSVLAYTKPGDVILLKGSRATALENLFQHLEEGAR